MSKKAARASPRVAWGRGGRGRRALRPKIARRASRSFFWVLGGTFVVLLIISLTTFETAPTKLPDQARAPSVRATQGGRNVGEAITFTQALSSGRASWSRSNGSVSSSLP